jgi:hypothetical protein
MSQNEVEKSGMRPAVYFEQLVQAFPPLKSTLGLEDGLVHFSMERFADYTIEQIKTSNWNELKKCFEFQKERVELLDYSLENARNVSYCESLLLGEVTNEMKVVLPYMGEKLRKFYVGYKHYYNDLRKRGNAIGP